MARYIDADKMQDFLVETNDIDDWIVSQYNADWISSFIESQPTADVVEVKHGEWGLIDECANEGVYCSVCYKKVYKTYYANQKIKSKFCPNCDAKMDGGKKE